MSKTIIRPAGAFPNTKEGFADYQAQFEGHDFSSDELYGTGNTGICDGDEGEEE
jgi:hypothetical protein